MKTAKIYGKHLMEHGNGDRGAFDYPPPREKIGGGKETAK